MFKVSELYVVVSTGVKTTSTTAIPASGWVFGYLKLNEPGTLDVPPSNVPSEIVCPKVNGSK